MKRKHLIMAVALLFLSAAIYSCRPQVVETPSATALATTLYSQITIEAPAELHGPVSALYAAFFHDESPNFVENNGDLIVKQADTPDAAHPRVDATFLPDTVMVPQTESTDVQNFVDFAISAEGQQVLIENGHLPESITITDQVGNSIELAQPVNNVISTYGPATAFIYSVDAGDRLVSASYLGARDPLGATVMEKIDPRFPGIMGDDFFTQQDFNVEQAATLDPDLIVTSARTAWLDTVEQLDLRVFLFDAETPDRLKEAMQLTGQLFGPHPSAQSKVWVAYYESIVATIREQTGSLIEEEKPRVLFTGTEPLRIASGDMYQTDIIQAAGGVSVSSDLTGYWNNVNLEQIAIWDPDVIIVPPYGGASVEAITDSPEWQILDAVQAGRVYQMPKLVVPWDTPAPDSALGIVWMAQRLHPDLVEFKCGEEAEYFYNNFYDYRITEDEIASICRFE